MVLRCKISLLEEFLPTLSQQQTGATYNQTKQTYMSKKKKQLTEEQLAQLDKDIEFIQQSIDKAKKRLRQYGKIK